MGRTMTAPVRTHVVVGDRVQVRSALARAVVDGRLAGARDLVELPGRRVRVTADLREPARRRDGFPAVPGWVPPVLMGALGLLVAGGLVWLLVLAVSALLAALTGVVTAAMAWVSAHLGLFVLAGVAVLALAVPVGARCAGLHCGGCPR